VTRIDGGAPPPLRVPTETLPDQIVTGSLCVAAAGPRWVLATGPTAVRLDAATGVLGSVVAGIEVVRMLERTRCREPERPALDVVVAMCGEM
jgi:hypothetical protein